MLKSALGFPLNSSAAPLSQISTMLTPVVFITNYNVYVHGSQDDDDDDDVFDFFKNI